MQALTLQTVRVTDDIAKFSLTVLPQDLSRTIQSLFLHELAEQQRAGIQPTQIIIDGGRGHISTVKKRARAFFSNTARMVAALEEAYQMLRERTRVETGAARASYEVYLNGQPRGKFNDIPRIVQAAKQTDLVSIVGPGVIYGRKLYWRPLGKQRTIKKKVAQYTKGRGGKREQVKVYGTYQEPMQRGIKRVLKKQFPDLRITDAWVELAHGTGKRGERWPAISIRMR
jgi:hypothetical protein